MYDNSNVQWFSQTLLTYKDKAYATNGYLRVSLSTNTEDFKFFNPPTINISIQNNYQKSINLNLQNAKDLIKAFKSVLQQLNGNEIDIQRKYQRETIIHFKFKVDETNSTRIVVIEIRNNESDFTKIVIPLEGVFEALASCIREFTEQYMFICSQLFIQSVQSQTTQIIHQLPSLIKGISLQIIPQIPNEDTFLDSRAPEIESDTVEKTEATINDLDKFLGDDMENIKVAELEEEEKKPITEIDSLFVKNYLDNDLYNLETAMTNYFTMESPLLAFASDLKSKIGSDVKDESFTTLPGIDENDLKSLVYLSKLLSSTVYQNYIESSVPMPATTPVFRYDPKTYTETNLELAYDLFLFNLYVRTVRRRIESKTSDAIGCKALFNIQLRCFSDPFVFSFVEKVDSNNIPSILMNRYRYYETLGVFKHYTELLGEHRCPEITDSDILGVIDEAVEKVVGKTKPIKELHEKMMEPNSLRIPAVNTLSLEQITNEVLPLEIAEKTGKDITKQEVIDEFKQRYNISDEILEIFSNKKKKGKTKSKVKEEKISNLVRAVKFFGDEVPKQYQDKFYKYLNDLGEKNFILQTSDFPIDEFGDNVVKALYLWKPEDDPVVAKNYKKFQLMIENEIMERDLILAKLNTTQEESGSEWDFA